MGLFGKIVEKQIDKVKESFKEEVPRIDENWPLNFALGRTVKIEETPFILAGTDSFLEEHKNEYSVLACGKSKIEGLTVYNFYLEEDSKIVVFLDDKENIVNTEFMKLWDRINNTSFGEWDIWLNKETGLIGQKDFNVDDVTFNRVFPEGGDKVDPYSFHEKFTTDYTGILNQNKNHRVVSYARKCGEIWERLNIDNVGNDQERYIDIYIGMEISQEYIKVF